MTGHSEDSGKVEGKNEEGLVKITFNIYRSCNV
jgi:hypothetical protein